MEFKTFANTEEKKLYLAEYADGQIMHAWGDRVMCDVCKKAFTMMNFKVALIRCEHCNELEEIIVCPNAPKCDGWFSDFTAIELLN